MAKYLDPKNDLLFKRIFGEHKDILISFLNSFLPLGDKEIKKVEYLTPEQIPKTKYGKYSIVDVRCTDNTGRSFIVEMQNKWSNLFSKKLLVDGAKAIVKQMDKEDLDDEAVLFSELKPVYILAIINSNVTNKDVKKWKHYLRIQDTENPDFYLGGLDYILLELPKFKPETWNLTEKKMAVLWLRFLKEIKKYNNDVPEEFQKNKYIRSAMEMCEIAAYSPEELEAYERIQEQILWDKNVKFYEETIEKNKIELQQKDKTIEQKGIALEQKDIELQQKDKAIEEKDKEIERLKELISNKIKNN